MGGASACLLGEGEGRARVPRRARSGAGDPSAARLLTAGPPPGDALVDALTSTRHDDDPHGIPGYLGEESWENASTGLVSNVYYWESLESLQALMAHPAHIVAKQRQAQWLKGYQVVIAEVLGSYGDKGIAHPLAHVLLPLSGQTRPHG